MGKCQLTIWHQKGMLIWLMPPANTPNVSPVWKKKLISVCQPVLLMRILLQNKQKKTFLLASNCDHLDACTKCMCWAIQAVIKILKGSYKELVIVSHHLQSSHKMILMVSKGKEKMKFFEENLWHQEVKRFYVARNLPWWLQWSWDVPKDHDHLHCLPGVQLQVVVTNVGAKGLIKSCGLYLLDLLDFFIF